MGVTNLFAKAIGLYLQAIPSHYAVKTAGKIRAQLDRYKDEHRAFSSATGPILITGLKLSLGTKPDISFAEPETIRWIDKLIETGDTLWDIGSHVGVYTLYAAKKGAGRVYAFEASPHNYGALIRNVIVNGVDDKVVAMNLAMSDHSGVERLLFGSFQPGSFSTLQTNGGSHPEARETGIQHVFAMSGTDFVRQVPGSDPDHIKLDVDGNEAEILNGLDGLLAKIKSLSIEIEPEFEARFEQEFLPKIAASGLQETAVEEPNSGRNRIFVRDANTVGAI